MAQLNPNFEIDFSDINSYEQIQLINDTQLAKENLLMHRAYKEPADDAIIRNHFSSFTFVDFCPKLYTVSSKRSLSQNFYQQPDNSTSPSNTRSLKCYELESFSDLFERINSWLKLNRDWRVVSMETLVFDCKTQFNHLKSSIHSSYLPQNTRGLRLFLSPSKSRFSGPQKIGCINVVPRKISGSHTNPDDPPKYENLDQILNRLNELLLTRPIEGRILSVETITLPMVNGYVNTESNYFMDSKMNSLYQNIYNVAHVAATAAAATDATSGAESNTNDQINATVATPASITDYQHTLIDILRVYYEFGPMICGLVNLIDFVPRFYSPTPTMCNQPSGSATPDSQQHAANSATSLSDSDQQIGGEPKATEKVAATESLTRLIRRSLSWFESERKRILRGTKLGDAKPTGEQDNGTDATRTTSEGSNNLTGTAAAATSQEHFRDKGVNIKCCNLQVHRKIMLKNELAQINPNNALQRIQTRNMSHERPTLHEPVICHYCCISTHEPVHIWCKHIVDLCQPYDLKYVRLAYVVPVYNLYSKSIYHMKAPPSSRANHPPDENADQIDMDLLGSGDPSDDDEDDSSSDDSNSPIPDRSPAEHGGTLGTNGSLEIENVGQDEIERVLAKALPPGLVVDINYEGSVRQTALDIVRNTNQRLLEDEINHQLGNSEDGLTDAPIGQLTYRLFAPCQLVNSSSCFSINPVNSSSPLARRGSLDLNGSGVSSDNVHPSTSLLGNQSGSSSSSETQQLISFGAIFPALSHDLISTGGSDSKNQTAASKFTTNEFEAVDAIRRRMEIYVTTNSMKVIAAETLTVNLNDYTSCLSTAIERTIVRASFVQRSASTWASVYVLYAAVEEPLMPAHLLASQKQRELSAINEEPNEEAEQEPDASNQQAIFDDDFKGNLDSASPKAGNQSSDSRDSDDESEKAAGAVHALAAETNEGIRIEENPDDSSLTLYNSAYDRTVALPTRPDNQTDNLEPIEFMGSPNDCLWLDEADIIEAQQKHWSTLSPAGVKKQRKRKAKKRREDSQCSIM